ncbi:alkyldihydroxyacetonephosphate synthase, peroxisomal [Thraustotheca clavata]|uniref:Alkylglycerone-phosphate synthase n=1 Tax=Thraustotheca clavata TaxID=74557 RepID=A0A1W0A4P8_9STRA|nr:alkyldihydroxyacetonephosphate synthase, peroxisomal [Thraustotheca clavata]
MESSTKRLQAVLNHVRETPSTSSSSKTRWDGWGYEDTHIFLNPHGVVEFAGTRYEEVFPAARVLPGVRAWAESKVGLDVDRRITLNTSPPKIKEGSQVLNQAFLDEMKQLSLAVDLDPVTRVRHSHGQTCGEIFRIRTCEEFDRVPDAVISPLTHEEVEAIVQAAVRHGVVIIPYGGGTNVSNALTCSENEKRMIVSLDMRKMTAILSIDKENMIAVVEAGIAGLDLHNKLKNKGVTLGHEPDSWEFSTVGGWIATRASGMKKNTYGNIEDMVINLTMVTAKGTMTKSCNIPRMSMGPDMTQMALGSEGLFGVVTKVVFRIRPLPQVQLYDSILFPTFADGIAALHDITRKGCIPASLRLLDNTQFQLGQALKPESTHPMTAHLISLATKAYVTKIKGFNVNTMCAATILFEGTKQQTEHYQREIHAIAAKHGGMIGGAENGKRGYFLTYVIAYIRDFVMDYYFLTDSFETAVPWTNVTQLVSDIKEKIDDVCDQHLVPNKPVVMCRISQVYETGVCLYVYYGVNFFGVEQPLQLFHTIEKSCVDVMLRNGAALSHHHGIGKHRKQWLPEVLSTPALTAIQGLKDAVDPTNVFATSNIIN